MKWAVSSSILFCAANFVTALSFLACSCYNLSSTENRYPVPAVDTWRGYLLHMIPLSACIMVLSMFTCWGVTRPRNKPLAAFIVLLHLAALAVCIVYCRLVAVEIEHASSHHDEIKNRTLKEFERNRESKLYEKKWVPEWLDSVQKQSKSCCGVIGFEDWREFWPGSPEVPPSCCRSEQHCITDIDQIDWPEKPTDYIKNDEGCAPKIVEAAIKRIQETFKFLIVLIVLITFAIIGFGVQYLKEFLFDASAGAGGDGQDPKDNGGRFSCFTSLCSRFMKRQPAPPEEKSDDPCLNGQNNIAVDLLNLDQPEMGTYSYTYLEQLKQQQSGEITGKDPISQLNVDALNQKSNPTKDKRQNNSVMFAGTDPGIIFNNSNKPNGQVKAGIQVKQQQGKTGGPATFTYEVVTANAPNRLQQGGSAQSLPEDVPLSQEEAEAAGQALMYNDDSEKQNLKQLLRFGRRHRRHRKGDMDSST